MPAGGLLAAPNSSFRHHEPLTMSFATPAVIASIIAAVTALVAVVVGPFVTIKASKTQMLRPMRQAWINSLRDAVAEYIAKIQAGIPNTSAMLATDEAVRTAAEISRVERQLQLHQIRAKIKLLINPAEARHRELVRLVEEAQVAYATLADATPHINAIVAHTQVVLKAEWEAVKK